MAFSAAGTVDLGGTSQTIGAISTSSAGTILNNGGGSSILTINGGGTTATVFKDHTAGLGTLGVTVGGNTLILSGANTYTGATTITAGTLQAGVATIGGASPTSGAFGVNSRRHPLRPRNLDLKGFNETIGSLADNSGSGGTITSSCCGTPILITGGWAPAPPLPASSRMARPPRRPDKDRHRNADPRGGEHLHRATTITTGTLQAGVATVGGVTPTSGLRREFAPHP